MSKLFVLCLLATGCSASSRDIQIKTANAVAIAANGAAPVIAEAYKKESVACVTAATTRIDADVCRMKVEQKWVPIKLAWDHMRDTQGKWADALAKHDPDVDSYVFWLRTAYCDLAARVPVKLPSLIAGVSCDGP